jgi:hypothetical protein
MFSQGGNSYVMTKKDSIAESQDDKRHAQAADNLLFGTMADGKQDDGLAPVPRARVLSDHHVHTAMSVQRSPFNQKK